jgi:hypothetical protein
MSDLNTCKISFNIIFSYTLKALKVSLLQVCEKNSSVTFLKSGYSSPQCFTLNCVIMFQLRLIFISFLLSNWVNWLPLISQLPNHFLTDLYHSNKSAADWPTSQTKYHWTVQKLISNTDISRLITRINYICYNIISLPIISPCYISF